MPVFLGKEKQNISCRDDITGGASVLGTINASIVFDILSCDRTGLPCYENMYIWCTGWCICIWTIFRGCLEASGWLKTKNFNSSKKFIQIPLKIDKVYFFDIKHGLTMTFWNFFTKSKNYAIPKYGLQYP